jgi:Domain of unknown function (DUF1707)
VTALLVSDQEREYTVGLLRRHWLSGRLTAEEFEERVAEAWRARYATDLWQALRELPVEAPVPSPRAAGNGSAVGSLVTGLLAISLLLMSFGLLSLVTLPLAATAWGLGREARRSGDANRRTAAVVGEVLGVVGTLLSAAWLAGCAAVLAG